eukprot:1628317-Pyramimonas_sp.AAC.1
MPTYAGRARKAAEITSSSCTDDRAAPINRHLEISLPGAGAQCLAHGSGVGERRCPREAQAPARQLRRQRLRGEPL